MFKLKNDATCRISDLICCGHWSFSCRKRSIDCRKLTSDIAGAVSAPACFAMPA
eukprot:COSAG06_NODE_30058_length_545_cov_1.383408_1_plen_53_part_10